MNFQHNPWHIFCYKRKTRLKWSGDKIYKFRVSYFPIHEFELEILILIF